MSEQREIQVKVGQRWKRGDRLVTVIKCNSETHDDWRIQKDGVTWSSNIYGWNLNRFYELVQDVD